MQKAKGEAATGPPRPSRFLFALRVVAALFAVVRMIETEDMGYTLTCRKVVPPGDSLLALALWGRQCFRVDPKTNRSPLPAMPRTWDSFKTSRPGSRKGE